MADVHLSHDEFFSRLSQLFDKRRTKGHGSIFLTQKRLSYVFGGDATSPSSADKVTDGHLRDLNPPRSMPVLIRATDGLSKEARKNRSKESKVKISTLVQPDSLESFYMRYADTCKAGMSTLKKRDRSKRKKDKAKKRKGGGEGDKKTEAS